MSDRGGVVRYFPHLAGTLVLAGAGIFGFLAKWEPDKRDPGLVYADKLAGGLPTVCKGITKHITTTPVIVGERWSEEKCYKEEAAAIIKVQGAVALCFKILPPQYVFDAASSHAWNNGASATCGSLAMQAFAVGDWELGCRRLSLSDAGKPVWSFVRRTDPVTKKPMFIFVQGLANRREEETFYCNTGKML